MKEIEKRLKQVHSLIDSLSANRNKLIDIAIQDTGFTFRECHMEVDTVLERLKGFDEMIPTFATRQPICRPDQSVALVLPYNGSAWLNTAIISIYLVGNPVRVKFASRDSKIAAFTKSIYRPIFGDAIKFDVSAGKLFLKKAITDPSTPAICLFGSDEHARLYRDSVKTFSKKFVFEGPGKDPFIVLPGADLEAAARELAFSKYLYAGQTCTAPERVYLHRSLHDDFLKLFLDLSRAVKVGDPADPETEMGPVASERAIAAIRAQLKDAVEQGARIVLGGRIDGHMVVPTVVVDVTQNMLGVQNETFGPVSFIRSFENTEEALRLARDNRYGLRATIYGDEDAVSFGDKLVGEPYCHPVDKITLGRFGTVGVNQGRSESWKGAFVSKPVGGYGYSGWIWETVGDQFVIKQGPKLLSLETSGE